MESPLLNNLALFHRGTKPGTTPPPKRFYSDGKEELMRRVNPYKPHYDYEYSDQSLSGALLFVGLLAAIILAAIVWSSYSNSQLNLQPAAGSNFPQTTQQPMEPRTTPPGG
jgi:hypothetical protein